jgi:hypothetical protein
MALDGRRNLKIVIILSTPCTAYNTLQSVIKEQKWAEKVVFK